MPWLLVIAAVVAAFANSLAGDFVFDDIFEIEANPALRRLWPPWEAMTIGTNLPARPVPSLSFAIDHAIWGDAPGGYHVGNILIHAIAAVALYELTRLTLSSPKLRGRFGDAAAFIALATAIIWAVHPLQTQAVTYIYQRIESMAGMFCLVSLACFARAASASSGQRPWQVACLSAAALAMLSKESAIVLPLLIAAYDWTFWAEPPKPLSGSGRFYALLVATMPIVGVWLWLQRSAYGEFAEPGPGMIAYALTQPGVILHYLRLAVWPVGLCLDYCWPIAASPGEIVVPLAIIVAAVAAIAWGLSRRRPWGWLGAAFLLALAPTSSVMPVLAPAAEHRMYLPLAAVVAGLVGALVAVAANVGTRTTDPHDTTPVRKGVAMTLIGLAIVLGMLTHSRNRMYRSREGMWQDIAVKRPDSYVLPMWLAGFAHARGDWDEAIRHAEEAVRRRPKSNIFGQLATAARDEGRPDLAESMVRRYLELVKTLLPPDDNAVLSAKSALASTLVAMRRQQDAESICHDVINAFDARSGRTPAGDVRCQLILASGMLQRGDVSGAVTLAKKTHANAVSLAPWHPAALKSSAALAETLLASGEPAAAERVLRESLAAVEGVAWRRTIDATPVRESLASLLEATRRYDAALEQRQRILEQATNAFPSDPTGVARANIRLLGVRAALARQQGMRAEEEECSRLAAGLAASDLAAADPLFQSVIVHRAAVLHQSGRTTEAELLLKRAIPDTGAAGPAAQKADLTTLQSGLADLYARSGRLEESLAIRRGVLQECLNRYGNDHASTKRSARAVLETIKAIEKQNERSQPAESSPN